MSQELSIDDGGDGLVLAVRVALRALIRGGRC